MNDNNKNDVNRLYANLIEYDKRIGEHVEKTLYDEFEKNYIGLERNAVQYQLLKIELGNKKLDLLKKYDKDINTDFRDKLILQIRDEARMQYPSVGVKQMLKFSANTYIYACLLAHDIEKEEQDAVKELISLNNIYIHNMQEFEMDYNYMMEKDEYYLNSLIDKYKNIIKERIGD